MKRWWIAAVAGCLFPLGVAGVYGLAPLGLLANAGAATTRPGAAGLAGASTQPQAESEGLGHPPRFVVGLNDWDPTVRFMQKYSPSRLRYIQSLPEGPRRPWMLEAIQDYRAFERARGDKDLANTIILRLRLEDELFDLAAQLRQAPPRDRESLINQLRQKVSDWTDTTFLEREERLQRLRQTLELQQKRLEDDRAHRDQIVEERFRKVMREVHLPPTTEPTTAPGAP